MRRSLVATLLVVATAVPLAVSGSLLHGYAQVVGPQGDEFNYPSFTAPFTVRCAAFATQPCPDSQSASTWSLDAGGSGVLRLWTQYGSLLGTTASSSNNARNLVLQPFNPAISWTVTTKLSFPATTVSSTPLGQTAGLIVYQDDDNFLFVGRVFNSGQPPQLEFVQETNGVDAVSTINETQTFLNTTVYLQLTKSGTLYSAAYSYDNVTYHAFTPGAFPTPTVTATATGTPPTATAVPAGYIADFASPQVGLFAWGGTNSAVNAYQLAADFDWFRVGNPATPAPVPSATSTATAVVTETATTVPTSTAVPTATGTPVPTQTSVPPTATAVPATPTNTPAPTPTPIPRPRKLTAGFKWISVWYHFVKRGTFEHLVVQANHNVQMGIWVHVIFPSGVNYAYFENTNANGQWSKSFIVPSNAMSRYSPQAVVTFQLWHGKSTAKNFAFFTVL